MGARVRRGLRSGSQITETRTFGFAVEIGAPVAEAAGALAYIETCAPFGAGSCERRTLVRAQPGENLRRVGLSDTMRLSSSLALCAESGE